MSVPPKIAGDSDPKIFNSIRAWDRCGIELATSSKRG